MKIDVKKKAEAHLLKNLPDGVYIALNGSMIAVKRGETVLGFHSGPEPGWFTTDAFAARFVPARITGISVEEV